ncbi:hypothetical protein FB45DRAFT_1039354 [Roridomyces roridus]|uniref:Uncharacterized protein n=1 Tax=Roridomyces roridus TaxID=1738132 RepID=A0AAD7B3F6_9AGAR|nr:hypothetical protein FB45DRAFT_1039354 [Roridomyces roridus]
MLTPPVAGFTQLPRRRLRSNKEYSPFDLALGLAIEPAVYFDAEEQLRICLEEQQASGQLDEPEDTIVPALSSLSLNTLDSVVADAEASIPAAAPGTSSASADTCKSKPLFTRAQRRAAKSISRAAKSTSPAHYRDRLHQPQTAQQRHKIKSKIKRDVEGRLNPASTTNPKLKHIHLKRAREATSSPIHVDLDANDLPHSKPGWIGVRKGQDVNIWEYEDELSELSFGDTGMGRSTYTRDQVDVLVGKRGFRYVPWLGWLTRRRHDPSSCDFALEGVLPYIQCR